jgi:endosialidase-like protein
MKTTTPFKNSINRSLWRNNLLPITLVLACIAFLHGAQAVSPPPDGGYPGGNTAEGQDPLLNLTTGMYNTAVGLFSLESNITGNFNTAIGAGTLLSNTVDNNTATGAGALLSNTTGESNTADGVFSLFDNTTGGSNTSTGFAALGNNTTGSFNTANGVNALLNNTTANKNTATGFQALQGNTTGANNTANGFNALASNTTGFGNGAMGFQALQSNTTGNANIAIGTNALVGNTTGGSNTAIGNGALFDNTTGDSNTALGVSAGLSVTTASNVICIGTEGANVNNSCFIGNIYSNVQPIVGMDPDSVTITSTGRLGRGNVSSRRYKHDIKPIAEASEVLYALKPVSFRFNKEFDPTQTLAFGLIAEEVAEMAPDLVGRNPGGQPESVRYEQINAMLLNEFLKEHRKVEEQGAIIARQQKQIEALSSGLDKVNAQLTTASLPLRTAGGLEASKPETRTASE